jgi:hypothetical protein
MPVPQGAGTMSKEGLAEAYQAIWKQLFLRRNSMSEAQFAKLIKVRSATIDKRSGIWLKVTYDVTLGWATAGRVDKLLLKVTTNSGRYPDVPRDQFLDEAAIGRIADIELAAGFPDNSVHIDKVLPNVKLKFAKYDDALKKLHELTGSKNLSLVTVSFPVFKENQGYPSLSGYSSADSTGACARATVNLVTGASESRRQSCVAH